jgi:hypothetical protein
MSNALVGTCRRHAAQMVPSSSHNPHLNRQHGDEMVVCGARDSSSNQIPNWIGPGGDPRGVNALLIR